MTTEPPLSDKEKIGIKALFTLKDDIETLRTKADALFGKAPRRKRGPRTMKVSCPKCSAKPVAMVEIWERHTISFDCDENGIPDEEGDLRDGSPCAVEAICSCGHQWRLRGILQITDLRP